MKAEGKQGRRKYLRYGKITYMSTPCPAGMQAPVSTLFPAVSGAAADDLGPLEQQRNPFGSAGPGVGKDGVPDSVFRLLRRPTPGSGGTRTVNSQQAQ